MGIAGAPGAGKTSYAERLVAESEVPAVHIPMDGFHLADVSLEKLGLLDRKGAPETFDAWGYVALLRRLRTAAETVWAPAFDRRLEQPLAGAIRVDADVELVVTEGNYLLVDLPEWRAARAVVDEVWFVECDEAERHRRLVARHVAFGKTPQEARAWVARVDDANARSVAATRARADRVIRG